MAEKILFVDDDNNLLDSYRRQLMRQFPISTAQGGQEALELIDKSGPFAVIVSDMRMPGMDGIQFLAEVKNRTPNTVRIMLTGNADLQTSIDAVNEGSIFRFLTKPCPSATIVKSLQAGIEQYRLIQAEHELLEKTLSSSVKVLTEILSLINPTAFSRSSRIKQYVRYMAQQLKLPRLWQFEMAAMLSQIGCVTLPPIVLNKIYGRRELTFRERKMFTAHPGVGCKLLANIPRLELIARMIEGQQHSFKDQPSFDDLTPDEQIIQSGAQMLRIALDFDQLVARAVSPKGALSALRKRKGEYNTKILNTLEDFREDTVAVEVKQVTVRELEIGMVANEHVKSAKGVLLVPKGHEITFTVLERLRNFSVGGVGVVEPIHVRVVAQEEFAV